MRPVVGIEAAPASEEDVEITMTTPPINMVSVHRWMANQEVCNLMGLSVNRSLNYTCDYTGLGNTAGKYDLGYSLLVDTVELGCNYTYTNTIKLRKELV
ncbi:MAG: hypothetical protein GY931_11020 [Maribacter sp.]|nr:hypothetical protein [Maribacter sp.]